MKQDWPHLSAPGAHLDHSDWLTDSETYWVSDSSLAIHSAEPPPLQCSYTCKTTNESDSKALAPAFWLDNSMIVTLLNWLYSSSLHQQLFLGGISLVFEGHLDWITRRYQSSTLSEANRRLSDSGAGPHWAVSLSLGNRCSRSSVS